MNNDKGFTLIELVVSMVLLGIILTPAYALLTSGLKSWVHGTEHIDVVQNMRFSMDRMTMEIRQALEDPIPVINESKTEIEFYIPKVNAGGEFITPAIVSYQYDATDKELERKEDGGTFQPVASKIKSVEFSYIEPSLNIILVGIRQDGHEIKMTSNIVLRSVSR